MQVTELKVKDLDFHAKVTIPSSEIVADIENELTNLATHIKLPGFRVGKVPVAVIRKKYISSVKEDVMRNKFNKAVQYIINDKQLKIATEGEITDVISDDDKDLEFTVKFELMPAITIPDFKDISVEKPVLDITDADIDRRIQKLVQSRMVYEDEIDGLAQIQDQVTIDAIGYVDGKEFAGGKLENYKLVLGSKSFIDNFEDQLVGAKSGDELIVKVTFPSDYHVQSLAGKPAEFNTKLIAVHRAQEIQINDEFAKTCGVDDLETLRNNITAFIKSDAERQVRPIIKKSLFDQLEQLLTFDVPKTLFDKEYQFLQKKSLEHADLTESESEVAEYNKTLSLRRVRIGLLLSEYARLNNIKVTDDDLRNAVISQMRAIPEYAKAIADLYKTNSKALESLHGPILEEKAVMHIFENKITFAEKLYKSDEFEALFADYPSE